MNTPYGLEIIENCVSCKLRKDKWFCGLSSDVLRSFSASSHLSTYPGGAVLFVEGQMPRGGLDTVLGPGQALDDLARQGAHSQDGRARRSAGPERSNFRHAV